MNAGEYYSKIIAVGGKFELDDVGGVDVYGPADLLEELETVDAGNLKSIVQEHNTAVQSAERILSQPVTPKVQKEGAFELRVLEALGSYAGKKWYCTPSLPMLTADLGLAPEEWKKVRAALGRLELLGKIRIEKRERMSNKYTILAPIESEEDLMALGREQGLV